MQSIHSINPVHMAGKWSHEHEIDAKGADATTDPIGSTYLGIRPLQTHMISTDSSRVTHPAAGHGGRCMSLAADERDHAAVLDLVTVNVVHPGYGTSPVSIVSPLRGGPALRPTMEYPGAG